MLIDDASIGIIGGADGPTAIFITDGFGWINGFGLLLVLLILLPNIVYALRLRKQPKNAQPAESVSRTLTILEQIGRFGCMLCSVFDFGFGPFGYPSVAAFLAAGIGCPLLLLLYWLFWALYFHGETRFRARMLAILPSLLFFLFGLTLLHPLLLGFSLLFAICHIRITWLNTAALS